MNVQYLAPSEVPTPGTGEVTYFFDTTNENKLSYKDDLGNVYVYVSPTGNTTAESALIEITGKYISDLTCALRKGIITADEFLTIKESGWTITSTSGGNTTTVTIEGNALVERA